jgi:Spy/CpxP family protein refolding chaperone
MKQKALIVIIVCLSCLRFAAFAQQSDKEREERRKERFEKLMAERREFVSNAINLTEEEKKAFWPLCDELQMKKFELNKPLRDEIRAIIRARAQNQTVSEADYKKVIALSVQTKIKEAQLEQEYIEKFLKVIPAEKVFLYQRAEQQFGNNMIRNREARKND